MKAIQYQAYGSYEENRLVEVDRPKPKDSEVLVKMSTVGINPLTFIVGSAVAVGAGGGNGLREDSISKSCPAKSTIHAVLDRHGLVERPGAPAFVRGTTLSSYGRARKFCASLPTFFVTALVVVCR
jgi:hypothetical protein